MFPKTKKSIRKAVSLTASAGALLCFLQPATLPAAEQGTGAPSSLTHQMWRKIRLGELKIEGDHGAV